MALRFQMLNLSYFRNYLAISTIQKESSIALRTFTLSASAQKDLLQPRPLFQSQRRNDSSLFRRSGSELWHSVYGLSATGKKRGRGKMLSQAKKINLNKGQFMGKGAARVKFPGLSTKLMVMSGDKKQVKFEKIEIAGKDEVFRESNRPWLKEYKPRDAGTDKGKQTRSKAKPGKKFELIKKMAKAPFERGWTSRSILGAKFGAPPSTSDFDFEGFESILVQCRIVSHMTGTLGSKRCTQAFVVLGNGNGLVGVGVGKSLTGRKAIQQAKKQASEHLCYIPRFEGHTVYHNMHVQFHKTKMFIRRTRDGEGLRCHRVIKAICDMAGIRNIHVQCEGRKENVQAVAKGFMHAIATQETHQELADRTKLHVIEYKPEFNNCPNIVASPSDGIVTTTPQMNEAEDIENKFERYYFGGRMQYFRPKPLPPYYRFESYKIMTKVKKLQSELAKGDTLRNAGMWD